MDRTDGAEAIAGGSSSRRPDSEVPEAEGRILRVVLLEDGETVRNAFFDRGFKP